MEKVSASVEIELLKLSWMWIYPVYVFQEWFRIIRRPVIIYCAVSELS